MRYFLDTEFNEYRGELISLALVSEDGNRELYLAAPCAAPKPWVREHVMPIIECAGARPFRIELDRFQLALDAFFNGDDDITIIADWPDDIRYFCEAIIVGPGQMIDISARFEIHRVDAYPTTLVGAVQHNALWDARALRHRIAVRKAA